MIWNRTKAAVALMFAVPVLVFAAGCTDKDADQGERDKGSALAVVNMPDHWNNVAVKCFRGNGLYVTNNSGDGGNGTSLAVVPSDPVCK